MDENFKSKEPKENKIISWFKELGQKARNLFSSDNKDPDKTGPNWKKIGLISLIVLVAIFIVTTTVFATGIYYFKWDNKPAQFAKRVFPFPAAIVGLETVTINQVEQEANRLNHFYNQSGQQGEKPDTKAVKNQILERLIETEIANNMSKKYGVIIEQKEIDKQYDAIAKQNGGEKKLKKLLEEFYDLSVPEFKELVLRQLRLEKLRQKFENELRSKVKARHILIKVDPKAKKKEEKKAKEKAQNILKKVNKENSDFAKLAKKHSQDKATKNDGGQLPWFGKGDMVEAFEKAAFDMDIGQTSDLVKSKYGYHIVLIEDKRGEIEKNFSGWLEEAKESWMVSKLIKW